MSGRKQRKEIVIDYQFGIPEIIPSTQESFDGESFDKTKRKEEKEHLKIFKTKIADTLDEEIKSFPQFPTQKELFVFILQYFSAKKEYQSRDVDNLSKTVLDILKSRFYVDDGQVRTLLVSKKMDKKIQSNFAYIAIKELGSDSEPFLKEAGLARAMTLYYDLKKKGIL